MKLVVTRFRKAGGEWFVGEKDETMSRLLRQPMPKVDGASVLLTVWPTRALAHSYAAVVTRLLAAYPDRSRIDIRNRARDIVLHG